MMYTGSLKLQYYRVVLLQTKRGNSMGKIINAKPIFLLALFEQIEKGLITDNKIIFDKDLEDCYKKCYSIYAPNMNITPFYKPFFHLQTDGYWHIVWNESLEGQSLSAKFMRNKVQYASFDNALWDLLQDAETRTYFHKLVINHFLTNL